MRYTTSTLILGLMLGLSTAAHAQDAMSVWDTSRITVDGRIREWPSFFRFYISGAKLQFDFYNDSNYLYICIKAVDLEAQNRLMHAGVNFWFDPMGKKKQKIGLSFPLKLDGAPGDMPVHIRSKDPSSEPSENSRVDRLKRSVLFAQTSVKVTGMAAIREPEIPLQNKYGIEIAFDWDSLNILAVEYKIPLSLIYQHPVLPSDLLRPMGLGIVVGAIESPAPRSVENSTTGGGQRGGAGGGMGGAGGRGGGGGRGSSSQNNLANDRFNGDNSEQKVWLKVHFETGPPQSNLK